MVLKLKGRILFDVHKDPEKKTMYVEPRYGLLQSVSLFVARYLTVQRSKDDDLENLSMNMIYLWI